jgi:hypothetical protein
MPVKLPVYRLSPAPTDSGTMKEIAAILVGMEGVELDEVNGSIVGRATSGIAELDRGSVGIWAADSEHLGNSSQCPSLPGARRAHATSADVAGRARRLPRYDDDAPSVFPWLAAGATVVARRSCKRRRRDARDVQARYGVAVRDPGTDGEAGRVAVVGGDGRLGDKWQPIA